MKVQLSKARIEAIFTEWHRQWNEDPEAYLTREEHFGQEPLTAGQASTTEFLRIHKEAIFV